MNVPEVLQAIEVIKAAKFEEIVARMSPYSKTIDYIVVYNDNRCRTTNSPSFFYEPEYKYAFFLAYYGYTSGSWSKSNHELIAMLCNQSSPIISKVSAENWAVTNLHFNFTRYGMLAPCITIARTEELGRTLEYEVSGTPDFQEAWNFFLEVDENCSTLKEALIYKEYYKTRLKQEKQEYTLEQYKMELAEKSNIISQYEQLLETIESKIK
ncbi:MAG: hypothetical protein K0S09_1327 [Sphingobacteriaceae bacterium]|jgi:hypothetical protein|nr:hypothetical protein [Sphingobacteriaceae bacterium]